MEATTLLSKNALLATLRDGHRTPPEGIHVVDLKTHDSVYEAGKAMDEVYFPIDSVISVVTTLLDGTAVEVGTIGSEGTTGMFSALGASTVPNATFCQVSGGAFVMSRRTFMRLLADSDTFRDALNAYTIGYLNVVAQLVACNRIHHLDARCARWLLMTHDRVGRDKFPLTQEFLAMMLGVRRSGVTLAATAFADAGFIKYSRGNMVILNRAGLEKEACECYAVTKREFTFPQAQ
ncbi:MAG: Crp/Fnr family transcriptional regulator [Candidatus Eremiobacteraeota bacterium]|nr:Crp/Fnr family transcriptional regulator [Candidatus Eremiobacteraeota bacterium]